MSDPVTDFPMHHHRSSAWTRTASALGGAVVLAAAVLLIPAFSTGSPLPGSDSISAGGTHSCGIRADGTLTCWGDGSAGQLDDIPSGEFRSVSAGGAHSCAVRTDGTLACWGDNSAGQLDDLPTGAFRSISAGGKHSCGIRTDGTLTCWGDGSAGQLDDIPSGEFRSVSAGGAHSCAVRADGELICWGDDSAGQVSGVPSAETVALPYRLHRHHNFHHHHHYKDDPPEVEIPIFIAVAAGANHTCAIDEEGELGCWGDDSAGQLDGMPASTFVAVSAGGAHSCAVRASGIPECWGDDSAGQLDEVPTGEHLSISAGGAHSCGIRADGTAACWGNNEQGQTQPELIGPEPPDGTVGTPYTHTFTTTPQAPGPVFAVSAGQLPPGLLLDADGSLAGTPTEAGTFAFTVAAANGITPDASREVMLKVVAAPAQPAPQAQVVDLGLPPPTAGVNFNLEPIDGVSKVKCSNEEGFSVLATPKQVPISCQVDANNGVVKLTSATGEGGGTQSAFFWAGTFTVSQEIEHDWITEMHLAGRLKCERRKSESGEARASSSRRGKGGGRKLWGSGKGNYQTSGNYGSATVRGTVWLVRDRCDNSTLFGVREGIVSVEDFVKGITISLRPGQQYVAKASIPRLR